MVNLAHTKGNNTTGVHMLQRDKNGGFRIRTSPECLKRFTSVAVRPEHRGNLKVRTKFMVLSLTTLSKTGPRRCVPLSKRCAALSACGNRGKGELYPPFSSERLQHFEAGRSEPHFYEKKPLMCGCVITRFKS
jgi:hypothetical protein